MKKKLYVTALAAAITTSAVVTTIPSYTEAAKITDISNSPHKGPITQLMNRGIIKGYSNGTFKPNQGVTRGQAAKILAQVLDLETRNVRNPGFQDVSTKSEYYGAIAALVNAGLITGYEDKTFKPNNQLTRAQMAKILSLCFEFKEVGLTDKRFKDVKITDWHAGYIQALLNNKITSGTTATTFSPNMPVTRGQLASFIIRSEGAVKTKEPDFEVDLIQ